jgi:CheY-specific phosphatase CheX
MSETTVAPIVLRAAQDVLETMFFTTVMDEPGGAAEAGDPADRFAVTVVFSGGRKGRLSLELDGPAARAIAANFLGADPAELERPQVDAVICELGNMICGAAVSRIDRCGDFLLAAPVAGWEPGGEGELLVLPLEEGLLRARFNIELLEPAIG